MTKEIKDAIARLQRYSLSAGGMMTVSAARYDDALDRLVRHPDRVGDPRQLARQAERHARQRLARRRVRQAMSTGLDRLDGAVTVAESTHPVVSTWPPARWAYQDHDALLLFNVIDHLALEARDRLVIGLLAADYDIDEIARVLGVTAAAARVIVHRMRRRVYSLYRNLA